MSEVKVNKISPRTACGTVTLGDSGDTFTIPSGATITNNGTAAGFGATGAASWDTTVKTGDFTAVSGVGYFVNTTSGEIDVTLPAGTAGDVVAIKDYANTFDTYAVTLVRNGSDKIGGVAVDASLEVEGLAVTLVYVDATKGWLVTDNGTQDTAPTSQYVTATGGTITCSGDYRIHTFTGPGALCVSNAGNPGGSATVDYLVIAGGGGAAMRAGGGGGAGGYRFSNGTASGCYSAGPSPLGASALPVSVQPYTVTVGGGGAGVPAPAGTSTSASNGVNSTFSTITSQGGGGSLGHATSAPSCVASTSFGAGGSGAGGSAGNCANSLLARNGNTPPVSPSQGNPGGAGNQSPGASVYIGGGGGGAGATGTAGTTGSPFANAADGGDGLASSITGSAITRGGGGGGGSYTNTPSTWGTNSGEGGTGGGGDGGQFGPPPYGAGENGTTNTGGGGGGSIEGPPGNPVTDWNGGAGGSGIVIIRYKFQN